MAGVSFNLTSRVRPTAQMLPIPALAIENVANDVSTLVHTSVTLQDFELVKVSKDLLDFKN